MSSKNGHLQHSVPFSLITGASSGIGKEFAVQCAKENRNLALVALPDSGLEEVAESLAERYGVRAHYLNIDLTEEGAARQVYRWCHEHDLPVNLLINNAGMGFGGAFEKANAENLEHILQLNIRVLTMLTHQFIPELKRHSPGYIINLSSMSGLHPVPYKTIYAASKSYVYYFSQGLREELKNEPIQVSVVCPGPVVTNPEVAERVKSQGIWARLPLVSPEKVAQTALKGVRSNRATIIPGWLNKLYHWVQHWVPDSIKRWLYAKRFRKFQQLTESKETGVEPDSVKDSPLSKVGR